MKRASRIVLIGGSAGAMEALRRLLGQLPSSFPAPILVVQHFEASSDAAVAAHRLDKAGALRCTVARNGETLQRGHVYLAPADNHMLLRGNVVIITKGARENRYRPAIDPLFRSGAVAHGSAVISVVLSGLLDDGTEGTVAVKRCGGTTVVQAPDDAAYPAMPLSASRAGVDHSVAVREMGALLDELVRTRAGKRVRVPDDIRIEATIAERVLSDVAAVNRLGTQVPYNCPGCGGVLWQVTHSKTLRYRCHTGHSYTASALATEQQQKIEETLWTTLRMLEERLNLMRAIRARSKTSETATPAREEETALHIEHIRRLLVAGGGIANASRKRVTSARTPLKRKPR